MSVHAEKIDQVVDVVTSDLKKLLDNNNDARARHRLLIQAQQWEADARPLTKGPAADWAYSLNLIVDVGDKGPFFSQLAEAVFKQLGFTQR